MTRLLLVQILLVCAGFVSAWAVKSASGKIVTGFVTDQDHQPVAGVSVIVRKDAQVLTGSAADVDGRFTLKLKGYTGDSVTVKVSSVGYIEQSRMLCLNDDTTVVRFQIEQQAVRVPAITVSPEKDNGGSVVSIRKEGIRKRSKHSLVPTNPTSAIVQPQVSREGSRHSSKIRVNGTNPRYFVNGINVGSDPHHYGAFSIIPGSVVSEMRFHPQGTSARFSLPVAVELNTPSRFKKHVSGDVNLSLVEATGSLSLGNERAFLLGSVRKSVFDKLVDRFDVDSDRQTLPPTNFEDIFVSSGLKLSPRYCLYIDQYHVQDFLSYNTPATVNHAGGISIFQHTRERYFGGRLNALYGRGLLRLNAAVKLGKEIYRACPGIRGGNTGLSLALDEKDRTYLAALEADLSLGDWPPAQPRLTLGNQLEYVSRRDVSMSHTNWNFLPPDAGSDNPYVYQQELNQVFGRYAGSDKELNNSTYVSLSTSGRVSIESGLRLEYFGNLSQKAVLVFREAVRVNIGETGNLELFAGSFAENPVNKVLQPYQVLIRANLADLKPIRTRLAAVHYSQGPWRVGLFGKLIKNLPHPKPDFSRVKATDEADGSAAVEDGFITMCSEQEIRFVGGDITLELKDLLSSRLDLYGFYSYAHAAKSTGGVIVPYELNAPHKLVMQSNYRVSKLITVGADLAIRSGYPYTPANRTWLSSACDSDDRYSSEYYAGILERENSRRFPVNASFDVHVDFDFGRSELFLTVANLTDHGNPIINTSDGFIYDAGILPTVGYRYTF